MGEGERGEGIWNLPGLLPNLAQCVGAGRSKDVVYLADLIQLIGARKQRHQRHHLVHHTAHTPDVPGRQGKRQQSG